LDYFGVFLNLIQLLSWKNSAISTLNKRLPRVTPINYWGYFSFKALNEGHTVSRDLREQMNRCDTEIPASQKTKITIFSTERIKVMQRA